MESINAGEIVEHAVRRQHVNISELSRRMNVNRRTLYNWFQQKKLHLDVIIAIGQVINYDFSKEFKDEFQNSGFNASLPDFDKPSDVTPAALQDSKYYWMEKYITLLEDYKCLLQAAQDKDTSHLKKITDTNLA
ncbi:hypothetical protein PBAL39_02012 [Pedobacter sp. BAL39]|uniref:helix-turn-helix domain-containing protein n=1 Tax=Pedobacter sp. BAL39 TaxID=391596 RepID=UPI0001559C91|nr:helix-turn-helix domain-containing protein [Pedobacter sp. BAL39]EDM38351.1 hypothetical protein PBAL39_02012 [Pedobacter sp. BAL39]